MIKFSPIGPVTVDADMSIREFIKMLEENRYKSFDILKEYELSLPKNTDIRWELPTKDKS
jgi:hypothetical protein